MWEYAVQYIKHTAPFGNVLAVKPSKELAQLLDKMGREGWELVSATPNINLGTSNGDVLYFKRPKKEGN